MKRDNTRSHCLHCSPLNGGNDRERRKDEREKRGGEGRARTRETEERNRGNGEERWKGNENGTSG